jgi:arabinose-5-phosphate isomerase
MHYKTQAQRVFDLEITGLTSVRDRIDGDFSKAIALMMETLNAQRKIVVAGVGKSGNIGHKIAATLTSTGAPAVVLNVLNATHGDLGVIGQGDLALFISYSGETKELIELIPLVRRLGVRVLAMTGSPASSLALAADVHLDVAVPEEACPHQLAPTSSTTASLVMGDALAMVLLEARGFTREDFAKYHPGGSLGRRLLLRVSEVMRPVAQMAILGIEATVSDALKLCTEKHTGATAVVDGTGRLVGIFTHGDFVRHYQKDIQIGAARLGSVMHANPICVAEDKLAIEVLNVFHDHPIDDLVVIDAAGKPVGLVDAQDLTKQQLM